MRPSFDDVERPCASGDIRVPTDFCGVLSFTRQGFQAIVHSLPGDDARASALYDKCDAILPVTVVDVKRDDASRRDPVVASSLEAKDARLQAEQCATK